MVGTRRARNLVALLSQIVADGVPGGFIECGCWRGGLGVVAAAAFVSLKTPYLPAGDRIVYLADTFQGIPVPDPDLYPVDDAHVGATSIAHVNDNSLEASRQLLARFGFEHGVVFLPGLFINTLPREKFSGGLAVVRIDGDLYESTIQALHYTYLHLSVGGFVIVDDFTDWVGCREATLDFRTVHGIEEAIALVHHEPDEQVRGVFWRKTRAVDYDVQLLHPSAYRRAAERVRRAEGTADWMVL